MERVPDTFSCTYEKSTDRRLSLGVGADLSPHQHAWIDTDRIGDGVRIRQSRGFGFWRLGPKPGQPFTLEDTLYDVTLDALLELGRRIDEFQ